MFVSMIRIGLAIFLFAALPGASFTQDRQPAVTDDTAEKQDVAGTSLDHGHHPRTVILVAEQDDSGKLTEWWRESGQPRIGFVGGIVKERLTEHGYEMIDHATAGDVLMTLDLDVLSLKVDQAKVIGKSLDAEVAIIGKAIIENVRRQKSSHATYVQLKAYWLLTGQYIGAAYTRVAVDGTDPGAMNKALKQAAQEGADQLIDKLSHFCMEHGSHHRL